MRTNIVIEDKLMRDTLRATGLKTKREAVELGLRTLLRLRKQGEIKRLRGMSRPQFRLRVGEIRVFYDVTEGAVEILAIITKERAQAWLGEEGV